MTKEQFIEVMNKPEIPMDTWFEYYKDRGGTVDFQQFEEIFTTLLWNQAVVTVRGVPKRINHASALNNFYNYYKTKFGL